jgi:hypothetical protein
MSEAVNATAFGVAGLGLPGMTWALDKLGYEVAPWQAKTVLAVSALCLALSVALWAHLLTKRLGIQIDWPHWWGHMPLHEAARRVYEAAEKADVLDLTTSPSSSPDTKLTHFKLLFIVDDDVEVFGVKPPSTKSRAIPKDELHGQLYPADGDLSQLGHVASAESDATYVNVTVRRSDVRRMIKRYLIDYVAQAREMRRGKWPR